MRIASLVPHATELLFALGAGGDVLGVTHECDHPPQVQGLATPHPGRAAGRASSAREIDEAVRERTLNGEAIYELDREALTALEPELIVTQALCPVCAVSYEEVERDRRRSCPQTRRWWRWIPRRWARRWATCARSGGRPAANGPPRSCSSLRPPESTRSGGAVDGSPRPRVLALEWLDPVFVAGHWTPQLIELAGGEDVLGLRRGALPGARLGGAAVGRGGDRGGDAVRL